jgi:hypothetical protein
VGQDAGWVGRWIGLGGDMALDCRRSVLVLRNVANATTMATKAGPTVAGKNRPKTKKGRLPDLSSSTAKRHQTRSSALISRSDNWSSVNCGSFGG